METQLFPDANKITKFQESANYWIFKTGKKIVKVKKREAVKSTASLEEIFCNEMSRRMQIHSPGLEVELATVKEDQQVFRLDRDNSIASPVLYFALVMNQLQDRYFLDNIIAKGRLKEKLMVNISQFLLQFHADAQPSPGKNDGTADSLIQKLNDLIYQSKKYLGETITQPMIDMTFHPLEKYINDNRKLLGRRVRKGLVKEIHGCFIPRKIHVEKGTILALGKTSDPLRDRYCDVVSDIADLAVELTHAGQGDMVPGLVDHYCAQTEEPDTKSILPIYLALKCLSQGLQYSVTYQQFDEKTADAKKAKATAYYEQAIEVVHQL